MNKAYPFIVVILLISCKKEYSGWNVYYNSKIELTDIAGNEECPSGGVLIKSGLDVNQNDILDSAEVDQTKMICNGIAGTGGEPNEDNELDKQIIIQLDMLTASMNSATPLILGELPFFNIDNYHGVDSVVLVGRPYIWPNEINTSVVELYNLTDNQVIANSRISSNKEYNLSGFISSDNCYSSFPRKNISLGIRLSSMQNGLTVATGPLYLYLYRK